MRPALSDNDVGPFWTAHTQPGAFTAAGPFGEVLESATQVGLGDDWLRAVFWDNGARLCNIPAPA